jgi:hypothetical protein
MRFASHFASTLHSGADALVEHDSVCERSDGWCLGQALDRKMGLLLLQKSAIDLMYVLSPTPHWHRLSYPPPHPPPFRQGLRGSSSASHFHLSRGGGSVCLPHSPYPLPFLRSRYHSPTPTPSATVSFLLGYKTVLPADPWSCAAIYHPSSSRKGPSAILYRLFSYFDLGAIATRVSFRPRYT